jgi:16S rRNA (adenine1518-N6/adenine1519-N6)-dimethyltransferase
MTPEHIFQILKQYHISPNKTYGQHFLLNEIVLEDMIDSSGVKKDDYVIEVGPGIGNLTRRLLDRGVNLLSIEKDKTFYSILKDIKKEYNNFNFILEDVMTCDFLSLLPEGVNYKVVANIPYYITGKIIQLFLHAKVKPSSLTLLIQREVAKNVTAKPGSLNILGISVQLYGDAKIIKNVLARDFHPRPKVDSAVLQIDLHQKPKFLIPDERLFFRVVKSCFAGKRKQIHNTLVNNLRLEKEQVSSILKSVNIDEQSRPQQLSIEQWVSLVGAVSKGI